MRLIIIFCVLCTFVDAQYWVQIADFPGSKRDDGVAVVVNNKAYFGTGLQQGFTSTIDFYALDLTSRNWTKIPDMPLTTERQYACAFAGTNCFYVCCGDNNGPLNNLYKYDITSATWTAVAAKPGTGLIGPACMVFGDKAIIVGGKTQTAGVFNKEVWEYTMSSNTWTQKTNFPFSPTWHANSAVLNNFGYMTLGQTANDSCGKEFYKYDPVSDTWTKLADLPLAKGRSYAAMQSVSNRLVLFAGVNCYGVHYNDMWYYNPVSNAWAQDISLPSFERRGGMSCSDGNHLYYSCGYNPSHDRLKETWMTDIPLGIQTEKLEDAFQIYPNPFDEELTIKTSGAKELTATISDILGKIIFVSLIKENDLDINTTFLTSGFYFLTIRDASSRVTKKIIKK